MNQLARKNPVMAAVLLGPLAASPLSGCITANLPGADLAGVNLPGVTNAPAAGVTGSEIGGTIRMAGITRQQAADAAKAHCAKYGRSSHILAVRSEDAVRSDNGVKTIFECT
jgi:hypothetical protein